MIPVTSTVSMARSTSFTSSKAQMATPCHPPTNLSSAGTFFGAIIAGDVSERIGRKWTVILGTLIYMVGVVIQMVTGAGGDPLGVIVAGRLVAGLGVGFESAIVILYMSEIVCISSPMIP